jgi:hypothetical protein
MSHLQGRGPRLLAGGGMVVVTRAAILVIVLDSGLGFPTARDMPATQPWQACPSRTSDPGTNPT